jgi:hypothetical protein
LSVVPYSNRERGGETKYRRNWKQPGERIILDQRGKDGTHVGLIQEVFVICGLETEPKAPPPVPAERETKTREAGSAGWPGEQ